MIVGVLAFSAFFLKSAFLNPSVTFEKKLLSSTLVRFIYLLYKGEFGVFCSLLLLCGLGQTPGRHIAREEDLALADCLVETWVVLCFRV